MSIKVPAGELENVLNLAGLVQKNLDHKAECEINIRETLNEIHLLGYEYDIETGLIEILDDYEGET